LPVKSNCLMPGNIRVISSIRERSDLATSFSYQMAQLG
jgi:hypothetical protein